MPLCVCVWVCMPLRGPSVSVFVCCLATSDACANEGKFSCFIWSWKILAGYVVVDFESPPEALDLAAVVCRCVARWCQRALQKNNSLTLPAAIAARVLLHSFSSRCLRDLSEAYEIQGLANKLHSINHSSVKVKIRDELSDLVFYGCHDTDMAWPTSASGVRCSVRLNLTAGIY